MIQLTPAERQRIAGAVGLNEQYLYQCFSGRRLTPSEHCAAIEHATDGAVMRWDLRPDDWHRIWPELKARKDAPKPPAQAAE